MKKTITIRLLPAIFALSVFAVPAIAQSVAKELQGFTKKFEAIYNKNDAKGLKEMYGTDAVRVAADGTTITGNENISEEFAKSFSGAKLAITIVQDKADTQADGSVVATGTYHVTGSSNGGDAVDIKGAYTNTLVKVNGKWKIAKSVLTAL